MNGTRNEGIRRLLHLARRLEHAHYAPSLVELAREFRVNPRTIRRDLELLEDVGCHVPQWRQKREVA